MSRRRNDDVVELRKDIPGFDGRYQASTNGRIRRVWPKSGKTTVLQPYTNPRRNKMASKSALRVHLTMPDGRRVERPVLRLVAETFFHVPEGKHAIHRNGLRSDNSVLNIAILSDQELGKRFGAMGSRRPVVKINHVGEVVACYPSARIAAKENHMSYQTVMDRCNNKVKKPYALDGFNYQWDEGVTEIEKPI